MLAANKDYNRLMGFVNGRSLQGFFPRLCSIATRISHPETWLKGCVVITHTHALTQTHTDTYIHTHTQQQQQLRQLQQQNMRKRHNN